MQITFWGVRGSYPVPGAATVRYGGQTSCVEARSAAGQTLIVLAGVGWTQCEGGDRTEIRAGDVVWCPCRRRHWHGASITTAMSHVAITEMVEGKNVEWMEAVTDEQYQQGPLVTA